MRRQIYRSARARIDLFEIANHISVSNYPAAQRFYKEAEKTIKRLLKNPELGFAGEYSLPNGLEVRRWPVDGFRIYQIIYRIRPDGIEVVRVLHGSRDIQLLLETKS